MPNHHHHIDPPRRPDDGRRMIRINHREDFPLLLTLHDAAGHPINVPEYDFTVRLYAGTGEYIAGRIDGNFVNCRPADYPCTLEIFVANHNLPPCSELMARISYYIPDSAYSDRCRRVVRTQHTGVCLTVDAPDLPGRPDFSCPEYPPAGHPYPGHHPGPHHHHPDPLHCAHDEPPRPLTRCEIEDIWTNSLPSANNSHAPTPHTDF